MRNQSIDGRTLLAVMCTSVAFAGIVLACDASDSEGSHPDAQATSAGGSGLSSSSTNSTDGTSSTSNTNGSGGTVGSSGGTVGSGGSSVGTGGNPAGLTPIPWEGGPAYWSTFPKANAAGWTDPNFFPVGVWYETAYNAQALRDLGITLLVGADHDGADLADAGSNTGMYFIVSDEWTSSEIGSNPWVVGWLASDEMDMNSGTPVPDQTAIVNGLRAKGDGRFVYANYGKGSLGTFWNPDSLPPMTQMVDVASDDLYFFTDPNLPGEAPSSSFWTAGAPVRKSASYGWTMDRMRSFLQGTAHPTWNFIEDGHPFSENNAPTMTPAQMEGAGWASLIHEARGLIIFNHSFGGSCQTQHVLFDCNPAMKDRMTSFLTKVHSLAPVLNSQSYQWTASTDLDTMLKQVGTTSYLFAIVSQTGSAGSRTITLPTSGSGSAEVMFENRSVTVTAGSLTDSFADTDTVHIYKFTP